MKELILSRLRKKEWQVILALILVAIAPILLQRDETVKAGDEDVRLVVISPHNVTIRQEFGEAFSKYWKEKTGQKVFVDWRTPGGTSQIRMVLEGDFARAEERGDEGIRMDVLFGGGDYIFKKLASKDRLVKLDVFEKRPEWFGSEGIKEHFSGERCFGAKKRWVGVCMSEFGICYNVDGIKRLGLNPPESWDDLADPKYFGQIALADPTKSGSVGRAFEMLLQQKIQQEFTVARRMPGETYKGMQNRCIREGWAKGMALIQKISANARYFTDSATKVPYDVAQGDAVVGMCIDFYGRTYNQKLTKADGTSRLMWVAPKGGTSTGVDPVAVFRGAPQPKIAQGFVEFLLTEHGQMIWNKRPGTENGPLYLPLRRLPVRPDLYTPENLKDFTDADQQPYKRTDGLVYDGSITGHLFEAMREGIRVMCIDTHDELAAAWGTLIEYSVDGVMIPRALERFNDVAGLSYQTVSEQQKLLNKMKEASPEQQTRVLHVAEKFNNLAARFRRSYADAQKLARKGMPNE